MKVRGALLARVGMLLVFAAICDSQSLVEASETTTYQYDALGRLISASSTGSVNNGLNVTPAYDPAGNRTALAVAGSSGANGPSLAINSASGSEGGSVAFTVTKTGTATSPVSVSYATANGTAISGTDYTATSGTLTFLVGDTTKTISVATTDDAVNEPNEAFTVTLSAPTGGASISVASGTGTIIDNDAAPSFAISGAATVAEGATLVFTVNKTGTTTQSFSVNYATADGTATAGSDYTATSGTLTFAPADTSKTVNVATIDDTTVEGNETVLVNLSGATGGATISTSQGSGTITSSDVANQPPVTVNDTLTLNRCGTATVNVVANDSDPEGNLPLVVTAVTSGTKGFATISGTTSIKYTANPVAGYDPITYTVRDSLGATSTGLLGVTITSGSQCQ